MSDLPILYSFRRCPYAMRARMAIAYAQVEVELREVLLRDKPAAMLNASEKGTVPVLVLPDGTVLDESLDIMTWALTQNDPEAWAPTPPDAELEKLIAENDGPFKHWLDRYKYADRYPEQSANEYRQQAEQFLQSLERRLGDGGYLLGDRLGLADVAIVPFVRQFSMVDDAWFQHCDLLHLRRWLNALLDSTLFQSVMDKHDPWQVEQPGVRFPRSNRVSSRAAGVLSPRSS